MGRAFLAAALAALTGTVLAGCDAAPAVPVSPQERPVPRHPTIVSLNPCSDAVLAEMADPGQILAISHYSRDVRSSSMDLAKAQAFSVTGGSVEEVLALQPDLVVASNFLAPATAAALQDMGVRVERIGIATTLGQSKAQVMRLAELSGHPGKGAAMLRQIDRAVARAAPPPGQPPISAIIWQSGGIVPGRDALITELLTRTGFVSHSAARGLRQADYLGLEAMLADPPRVILAAGYPENGEDRMLGHPALDALNNTRRYRFDPALLFCGGPTIIRAVDRLAWVRDDLTS
jgi:iron complex transport system substrate-binding protein